MATIILTLRYRADLAAYPQDVVTQAGAARHDIDRFENGECSLAELFDALGDVRLMLEAGE